MIEVSHLTRQYGPRTAIEDLTFNVKTGEVVGFLGPNGAGKSTTMKILTGFMPPTSGTVKVAGFDVFREPIQVKSNVGYLPETPPVYLDMQVRDYVEFAARIHGVSGSKTRAAVDTALEKTGLGQVSKRLIANLSKGYRQRVGLAQAIVHNPKVIILDEPTVGLDPIQIIEIRSLIKGLGGDHTVILSSHILPEVTATCQRIIVINKGRIVAEDALDQITGRFKRGLLYSLQVRKAPENAAETLRAIPGVRSVDAHRMSGHAVGGQSNRFLVEMETAIDDVREKIVTTAVQNGWGVLEFSAEKMSLEDVFLQLTTDEPHAAAAAHSSPNEARV